MKKINTLIFLLLITSLNLFSKDKPEEPQAEQYYDVLPDVPSCRPGVLKQSVIDDVLERVNHIRSLHKLPPVTYETAGQLMSMQGCLNMVASGQGGHVDDPSTPCYTPGGGAARMKSNIEYGNFSNTPEGSIVGWLIDDMNADVAGQYKVGHRRAILNPFLAKFAFGKADGIPVSGGATFSASNFLYQDYTNGNISGSNIEFVAYPFEYYPPSYINKAFYLSFNAIADKANLWGNQNVNYANTTVEMKTEAGAVVSVNSVSNDNEGWGSFPNNLSWKADGLQDEIKYLVTIKNVNVGGTVKNFSYWFKLTNINHTQAPAAPTLQIPENAAVSVSLTNAISWSLTENTSKFTLQVSENEAFTKLVINKSNLPLNNYLPTELDYQTKYWWRVASVNDAGTSPWSEVFTFTTSAPIPEKPYHAGPANNAVVNSTTPLIYWTAVGGAEKYTLEVSKDETFIGFSVKYSKSNITDTFHTVAANRLSNETDYWWRVKAVNGAGESMYTSPWKFNTGIPLPAPSSLSPSNGTETGLTPELSWNVVPGAASYNVQLSDKENMDMGFIINELKWNDVKYTVPADKLENGKTYYWRVKANSETGSGPFSAIMNFITKNGSSVNDYLADKNLIIYPNPAKESFYIELNDLNQVIDRIVIQDALGNEICKFSGIEKTGKYINMSDKPAGVYYIQVYSGNKIFNEKVTIVR